MVCPSRLIGREDHESYPRLSNLFLYMKKEMKINQLIGISDSPLSVYTLASRATFVRLVFSGVRVALPLTA